MDVIPSCLHNLHTISKLNEGQKISTTDGELINIESESMIQGVYRWNKSDSRTRMLAVIKREVHTAILVLDLVSKITNLGSKEHINDLAILHNAIVSAMRGVENLSITYSYDQNIKAPLKVLWTDMFVATSDSSALLKKYDVI